MIQIDGFSHLQAAYHYIIQIISYKFKVCIMQNSPGFSRLVQDASHCQDQYMLLNSKSQPEPLFATVNLRG